MYHQFSQYQQQQQEQLLQQQQQQMVWNGSSWVTQPQPQQQLQQSSQSNHQPVPPNPVQTYTQYYHGWTSREKQLADYLQNSGSSSKFISDEQRAKVENDRQWAKVRFY
jgi:hypothetical protein